MQVSFPSDYKPYADQTCMHDAYKDAQETCFRCWIWPTFSGWVNRLKILEQVCSKVGISPRIHTNWLVWLDWRYIFQKMQVEVYNQETIRPILTKLAWMIHQGMNTLILASDARFELNIFLMGDKFEVFE